MLKSIALSKRNQVFLGFLFFTACVSLSVVDVFRGFWDHDEGFFLVQSLAMTKGYKPLFDYPCLYPPLFIMLNAIPIFLGIDHWLLTWGLPVFWIVLNGGLTALCWKKYAPNGSDFTAWLVAGLFPLFCIDFGGTHLTLEHGITFFALLALLNYDIKKNSSLFWVGACVGSAFLCKQMGLLLILPFVTQLRTPKQVFFLCAGFFFTAFLFLAWIIAHWILI